MTHPAPLLRAERLNVTIGRKHILRGLTFSVTAGQVIGLLGPNGSGKTTLLRAISGLLPYEGSLQLFGKEIVSWRARQLAKRLATVRQGPALAFDFTVGELVMLGLVPHKRLLEHITPKDHARVAQALSRVDLAGFENRGVRTLSGGEQQRACLAQALVQDADLLLLDEPTMHLDVHHQFGFLQRVIALIEAGRTAITVFHDLELAARFCDTLLVLDQGALIAWGSPRTVVTASLLASVFRMHAKVTCQSNGTLRITYGSPRNASTIAPP